MLQVYLASHCPSFDRANHLLVFLGQTRPSVSVQIINMDENNVHIPEDVFGTPTYKWNGRIVSLGNPSEEELLKIVDGKRDEDYSKTS